MKALNGRVINHVCKPHAIEYGINKAKVPEDKFIEGYCDVCEAQGQQETPQNVTQVANVGGIRRDDLDIATPTEDGIYEFKPSNEKLVKLEKEEALKVEKQKDGYNKKTPGTGPKPSKA